VCCKVEKTLRMTDTSQCNHRLAGKIATARVCSG
jgi:hypothetical protein